MSGTTGESDYNQRGELVYSKMSPNKYTPLNMPPKNEDAPFIQDDRPCGCTDDCRIIFMRVFMCILILFSIGFGISGIYQAIEDISILNDSTLDCESATNCKFLFDLIEFKDCCECIDEETGNDKEVFAAQCNVANMFAESRAVTHIIQVIIGLVCLIALKYGKYNIIWSQVIYWCLIMILAIIIGAYVNNWVFWLIDFFVILFTFLGIIMVSFLIVVIQSMWFFSI